MQAHAPFAVRLLLGTFACLALSAQALEVLGLALGHALFRPSCWALATWLFAIPLTWAGRRLSRRSARAPARPESAGDPLWRWLAVAMLAVVALYSVSLGRTIRNGPRNWDGQAYHLAVPLQWVHLSSLSEPLRRQVQFGVCCDDPLEHFAKFAQPGNGHLLFAVPLLLGWDRLACLAQAPFLLMAVWAVYSLARWVGATSASAALAALAFASAPILAEQATMPMLDLTIAALSLVAITLVLSSAAKDALANGELRTAALAVGLALGTKLTALFHAPLAVIAVAASRTPCNSTRRAGAWLTVAALLAVPCAYWMMRSGVLLGNPVYPMAVSFLGWRMLRGFMSPGEVAAWDLEKMGSTSVWDTILIPFRDPDLNDETGFGALFVPFAALGLATATRDLAAAAWQRRPTSRGRLALLTLGGLLIAWFATARTPRFNIHVMGLLAAAAAPAADALGRGVARHLLGAGAVALSTFTLLRALTLFGWDLGPPVPLASDRQAPFMVVPPVIGQLPAGIIFNDTLAEHTSQPATYRLFGPDHRHLVYDHPGVAADDAHQFVDRLRRLGADLVFLRMAAAASPPSRYTAPELQLIAHADGKEYRSRLYRVRP